MMKDSELKKTVERACEINRQMKVLAGEKEALGLVLLGEMDERKISNWEDEHFSCVVVEQPGRKFADVKALEEAGLTDYIKTGAASRYALPKRR